MWGADLVQLQYVFYIHFLRKKAADVSGQTLTLPLQIPWCSFQWKPKSAEEIFLDKTLLHLLHTARCCSVSDTLLPNTEVQRKLARQMISAQNVAEEKLCCFGRRTFWLPNSSCRLAANPADIARLCCVHTHIPAVKREGGKWGLTVGIGACFTQRIMRSVAIKSFLESEEKPCSDYF